MSEVVRLHVELVRSLLSKVEEADRIEIMTQLAVFEAGELQKVSKLLDEQREETEAWKRHNEQRREEVDEAKKLLNAQPNETLPMAVKRATCEKFSGPRGTCSTCSVRAEQHRGGGPTPKSRGCEKFDGDGPDCTFCCLLRESHKAICGWCGKPKCSGRHDFGR